MSKLLRASEVAARLGLTERQVYHNVRMGRIPAIHIGRNVRFIDSQIDQWLVEGGAGLGHREAGASHGEVRHG